ncbi:hypothetical protein B0H17DRAFT_148525 [Mycena rosella]|uniref:Uncharacterized protein n=1 Tax=Mycena rosella TaxID=1033263 RepID=A0AAD7D5U8_MYCRO|nr:hypothetical protein B0H17DRAFT_148525 [Mycena rosella]
MVGLGMYNSRRFSNELEVQWCAIAGVTCQEFWLAQANYCFRHLQIASNYNDYDKLTFRLVVSGAPKDPPQGYLFIWIGADLPEGTSTFRIPDYPAYWSLDATGAERLTMEEASKLGFPDIEFTIRARGYSWDADVYVGLRKFHRAKRFDPYSQDVARHLDYPLYQSSGALGVPLAHACDESTGSKDEETHPTVKIPVAEPATISDEQPERPSRCWQVLMVVKATLIFFLLVCSLDKFLPTYLPTCGRGN